MTVVRDRKIRTALRTNQIAEFVTVTAWKKIIEATVKCPGVGAFDHLEWTYDGAFEQLFGLGRGEFEQKFSKNSNARGVAPGGGCLSFDLTGT